MWSIIERHIQEATEQPFAIKHKETAMGGDINLC